MARFRIMIVVMALLISFPVMADEGKGYYLLSPDKIARIIDMGRNDGRRVVFVYTSWCPYCRAALPHIIELEKQRKGSVIAISVDKDPDTLGRYLKKNYGEVPFHPIVWDRKAGSLDVALARFGIKLGNGIPFTALLDEYGYVHKQGVIRVADSAKYILEAPENKVQEVINQ